MSEQVKKEKFFPEVGTQLYLSQGSGGMYITAVRHPYTVIAVSKTHVTVQEAQCIFPQPRYYDTLPIAIEEDKHGKILELSWAPKKGCWQVDQYKTGYPLIAHFGKYDYFPYLD